MKINPDWLNKSQTQQAISFLTTAGHQAYFVGGCVRNALLGEKASDIDIATDAPPLRVIELAEKNGTKAIPTGIKHGTITIVIKGQAFEITSFRKDIKTDGRHAIVSFSSNIIDDAKRRDFTMNALYADQFGEIIDPLNGINDLLARQVKFIEDPDQRIAEDYLRILRFFRFFAWYGDKNQGIDQEGLSACSKGIDGIETLSRERIGVEISKLLAAPDPSMAVAAMAQSGILTRCIDDAVHSALAPMVHLEKTIEIKPDWIARIVVMTRANQKNALRLSRKDNRHRISLIKALDQDWQIHEIAYRSGSAIALQVALIKAASLGISLPKDLHDNINLGINAKFPIKADDIDHQFKGYFLGEKLRSLEEEWINSRFTLNKKTLLAMI